MAGIADLLYLGQPDPARQLASMLSGQQQPGQPPQGAPPPGAPPPPPGGAGAGPGAAPAPAYPGAPPPPGSPPQPQALQSTPDMAASNAQLANPPNIMSLYLQLAQRQHAEDQMNRGFALIAANHSSPAMARAIMSSVGGGDDAGAMVGNLMSLYQTQNQMAAQQALLQQAPSIDEKNGWPAGTARAEIMAGRGPDLIKSMEPTDLQRNYNWAHQKAAEANPNATPAEIDIAAQGILLGAGAGGLGGPDTKDRLRALNAFKANPANANAPTPPYMLDDQKWKLYNTDLSDAKTQFNGINGALDGFVGQLSEVSNDPALDKVAGHPIAGSIETMSPGSPERQIYDKMKGLGGTAKDMGSRGGPKGLGQNLKTLGSNPEDFTNLNYSDYRGDVIAPHMRQALTAKANAYGASGQLSQMPGYLKEYLDPMYKPGGEFDPGGGFKSAAPDTDANGKPLPQPDAAHLKDFKMALEYRGPEVALKALKDAGFDTSAFR